MILSEQVEAALRCADGESLVNLMNATLAVVDACEELCERWSRVGVCDDDFEEGCNALEGLRDELLQQEVYNFAPALTLVPKEELR